MNKTLATAISLLLAVLLAGCGGGGGSTQTTTSAQQSTAPAPTLFKTSYENAKQLGLTPITLPSEALSAAAYARHNFKGDGKLTLFTAYSTYTPEKPIEQATPGVFKFWTQAADGSWVAAPELIDTTVGCILPRKAVVADFNNDSKPDVLVACHGYDAAPFPGERNYLVLSTPSGVYKSAPIGDYVGFFHGASAADLDGDGLIDFVATDGRYGAAVRQFKNAGNGTFTEVANAFPATLPNAGYFTTELLDVDGDGKIDLLADGHEFDAHPTVAILNNGGTTFTNGTIKLLPAAADVGVVLDFVKVDNKLFVGRTDQGYTKLGIQTIDLSTNTATVTSKLSLLFYWLLPKDGGVISDRTDRPL